MMSEKSLFAAQLPCRNVHLPELLFSMLAAVGNRRRRNVVKMDCVEFFLRLMPSCCGC